MYLVRVMAKVGRRGQAAVDVGFAKAVHFMGRCLFSRNMPGTGNARTVQE